MKQRIDNPKNREWPRWSAQTEEAEVAKFELPIDLDEILAVAIFDSVVRAKRRKFRSRGAARRK